MRSFRDLHLNDEDITAYIDGELAAGERARVAGHLDACAECRDTVGDVVRMLRDAPLPSSTRTRRSYWSLPVRAGVGLALAASIATIFVLDRERAPRPLDSAVRSGEPAINNEGRAAIEVVEPADRTQIRVHEPIFVWRDVAATFYRITITASDGRPLWTAETQDTAITASGLKLEPGDYFWYVDAIGTGISATSGTKRFTVRR